MRKSKIVIRGGQSIFDKITPDDIIIAFFPCIYFSCLSQMAFSWGYTNYKKLTWREKTDAILQRAKKREYFYSIAIKMLTIAQERGLRLVMENPWAMQTYLKANFIIAPTIIDNDRTLRGDIVKKPTAYWFINCTPTDGLTIEKKEKTMRIVDMKPGIKSGVCSEERSMISPDYARNFICDFLLGKEQENTQLTLF